MNYSTRRALDRAAKSEIESRSPRIFSGNPQLMTAFVNSSLEKEGPKEELKLLTRVFRRWAKAARTT